MKRRDRGGQMEVGKNSRVEGTKGEKEGGMEKGGMEGANEG